MYLFTILSALSVPEYMHEYQVHANDCGGQKRASDPLTPELQVVMGHLTKILGVRPRCSGRFMTLITSNFSSLLKGFNVYFLMNF